MQKLDELKPETKILRVGVTVFFTVCAILVFYDIFFGQNMVWHYIKALDHILRPVTWGLIIAYILAPVVNFLERTILAPVAAEGLKRRKQKTWVRLISVLMTLAIVIFLIILLLRMLIPQVADSLIQIYNNLGTYSDTLNKWIDNLGKYDGKMSSGLSNTVNSVYDKALQWINDKFVPSEGDIFDTITTKVVGAFNSGKNLLLGAIVASYVLGMKETLGAQGKKILYGMMSRESAEKSISAISYTNRVFGGFIRGKLLDSLIIGIICFIGCEILRIPFAPLVAVVVGVTNIIPFFGPFIGAIPCCVLIFLIDPIKCFVFIIFIIALQQFDGNILGPKILGDSTGLASLWVIIAILVGGAIAGPLGMLLGCPIFALFYAAFRHFVNGSLEKKNMPVSTDDYRQKTPPSPKVSSGNHMTNDK